VLLAVSNQPVWSDSWALGGLFLASGLTGSAALLLLLTHYRRDAADSSRGILELGGRLFGALEVLLLVAFVLTLIQDGALDEAFGMPWTLLWLVAVAGMVPAVGGLLRSRLRLGPARTVAATRVPVWLAVPTLVLVGVLALRAAVIFSAQA
jgi:polysulfide reductase chain C